MKPKTNRRPKNRDIDKDTVVAYHEFIQGRIQDNLNGISIGPGQFLFKISVASAIFAFCCLVVGVLVVSLRHRHVYLVDWNAQFLGPFFIILALLFFGFATFLCMLAKQRTNHYRADLAFRPIGDCGVAVVHKSKLNYDDQKKSELKSGTNPHNVRHPGRPTYDSGSRGNYSNIRSYDNRGYKDDYYGEKRRPDDRPRRDYDRDQRDGRGYDDRPRRPRENGDRPPPPRRPREDGENRPPRRPREEGDRPPRRPDDRGPRPRDDRGRRPDDRERRPRPPPGSEEEKRREAGRRRYEEEKRRRYEEDRRRAELRKEAEAASYSTVQRGEERGVDVDGTRTFQIQTTVKLSREMQETDESEL